MRLYTTRDANRAAALEYLEAYVPAASDYGAERNHDPGPDGRRTTSRLSPFLRHRLLLEPEVMDAVIAAHGLGAVRKFVEEVYWRTYFKGWLQMRPQVWHDYREAAEAARRRVEGDPELGRRWREATEGRTGLACFDHWSDELRETGYLHNHARMWFASIWIFTLRLPWVLGAAFFLRHLLDGDAASNTLSWRWVGGLHTKGKIYVARAANIEKFTGGRFAPHGELDENPAPLGETTTYERRAVEPMPEAPPSDGRAYVLYVTDDDCLPEQSALAGARVVGVAGLCSNGDRDGVDYAEPVRTFKRAAVRDAVARAAERFGCVGEIFELGAGGAEARGEGGSDLPPPLIDWSARQGAAAAVLPRPPVGVNADALAGRGQGDMPVFDVDRAWDADYWRLATAGYFNFKKKLRL